MAQIIYSSLWSLIKTGLSVCCYLQQLNNFRIQFVMVFLWMICFSVFMIFLLYKNSLIKIYIINFFQSNGIFHKATYITMKSGWSIVYIEGSQIIISKKFQKKIIFLSLKIVFWSNSANPDEMPHYVAFHLCFHCLLKYLFRDFTILKGLTINNTSGYAVIVAFPGHIHLTLNATVVCFHHLLKWLKSLYGKQCGPRSDCSYRSSLFWVHAVCFYI